MHIRLVNNKEIQNLNNFVPCAESHVVSFILSYIVGSIIIDDTF